MLLGVFSLLEVAHWARVEYSLSFISGSSLLRGVCHLIVSTFGAATLNLTINMVGNDRSNDNCILLTSGPSPSLFNFSFSLLSANTLQEYSTSFSNSTQKKKSSWSGLTPTVVRTLPSTSCSCLHTLHTTLSELPGKGRIEPQRLQNPGSLEKYAAI